MALPNPHFESSYTRLFDVSSEEDTERFFRAFYERFKQHPDVARMFEQTDSERQIRMLKRSVFDLVGCYVIDAPSAELTRLSKLHRDRRIPAELLDVWLESLLQTIAEFDPDADELTRLGWMCALGPGIWLMRIELSG